MLITLISCLSSVFYDIQYSINKSNLNTIFIQILTIVIINFKLLLNIENKCAICQELMTKSLLNAIALILKEMGHYYVMTYEHSLNGPCSLDLNKPKEDSSLMTKKEDFLS